MLLEIIRRKKKNCHTKCHKLQPNVRNFCNKLRLHQMEVVFMNVYLIKSIVMLENTNYYLNWNIFVYLFE